MKRSTTGHVIDSREKDWYAIETAVLSYIPIIKPQGFLIYGILTMLHGKQVSLSDIAVSADLPLDTVRQYLSILEQVGLITTSDEHGISMPCRVPPLTADRHHELAQQIQKNTPTD